jgi:hypothetical protein
MTTVGAAWGATGAAAAAAARGVAAGTKGAMAARGEAARCEARLGEALLKAVGSGRRPIKGSHGPRKNVILAKEITRKQRQASALVRPSSSRTCANCGVADGGQWRP